MTIYLDLWYKVITTPRYDKRVAKALRLAHNHLLQRRMRGIRSARSVAEFGEEVARIEAGKATGLRVWHLPVGHEWVDYAEARYE